jgi:hypothetical protein
VCVVVFNLGSPPSGVSSATVGSSVQSELTFLISCSCIVFTCAYSCACHLVQRMGRHVGTSKFLPERSRHSCRHRAASRGQPSSPLLRVYQLHS